MNTTQLECFTILARNLNYVKTAEELRLTQPAVSRQIQSLEQELGAKLFHRTTRSVTLTPIGLQFLPEANAMLNTYYHSMAWISNYNKEARHAFRIGYMEPHAVSFISKVLGDVLEEYPNLTPQMMIGQTDTNLRRLEQGNLDLVIGMKDSKYSNESIAFKSVHEDHFKCIIARRHVLAQKLIRDGIDMVSTQTLWPYRQIVAIPPYLITGSFSRGRYILPINDDLTNIICNNTNEAYGMVLSGAGYAYIPEHLILPHPDLLFLKWEESPHSAFGIYYQIETTREKGSPIRKFIDIAERLS